MDLYVLPIEILLNILSNLCDRDLLHVSVTCNYMRLLSMDEHLWKNLLNLTYDINLKLSPDSSWYNNYIRAYNKYKLSSSQKLLLNRAFASFPTLIQNLKNVKPFKHYTYIPEFTPLLTRDPPRIMVLNHVVISYWLYTKRQDKNDYFVGFIDTKVMGKSTLYIKDEVLYASGHRGCPFTSKQLNELITTGTLIQEVDDSTEYTIYLTEKQLRSVVFNHC